MPIDLLTAAGLTHNNTLMMRMAMGVRTEQDLYARLIDSVTKQMPECDSQLANNRAVEAEGKRHSWGVRPPDGGGGDNKSSLFLGSEVAPRHPTPATAVEQRPCAPEPPRPVATVHGPLPEGPPA
ncbi:hypothetical protein CRUP_035872 [Coryphaenoides rupestris]|nr:hypothetical protein CRUP_035872 [Coryphaenoides rupestris]